MLILIIIAIIVIVWFCVGYLDFSFGKKPIWGATFSQIYVEYLGLDWKQSYLALLDDMQVKSLRLIAYWSVSENPDDKFNFTDIDWQVNEAAKRNIKVILTIGYKAPRWPECHNPDWANSLTQDQLQAETLEFVIAAVNHFKNNPAISMWQVENEPLITFFGKCPQPDRDFLKKELALVKSLDISRPIMLTDSGELSWWIKIGGMSDVLGTTLYRIVWHPWLGSIKHWQYTPFYYWIRAKLNEKIFGAKKVIIAEMQAEAWGSKNRSLPQMTVSEQLEHFSVQDLKNNMKFARKTGLNEIYLWGVEWAYWLKIQHNDPRYWDAMKQEIQ